MREKERKGREENERENLDPASTSLEAEEEEESSLPPSFAICSASSAASQCQGQVSNLFNRYQQTGSEREMRKREREKRERET